MMMVDSERPTETCLRHGAYEGGWSNEKLKIRRKCPGCLQDHEREVQALLVQEEADRRSRAILARLEAIGIPPRFHGATLDGFAAVTDGQKAIKGWAEEYLLGLSQGRNSGRSAIFLGRPGTGKTHIACALAIAAADLGMSTRYATVMRAIRRVKDSWRDESDESEKQVLADYGDCDLLVLDELGIQTGSQFEQNILFDLLNRRYEYRRPSVLVSNLSLSEVKTFLGERILDRLREDGGVMKSFEWESHRRTQA